MVLKPEYPQKWTFRFLNIRKNDWECKRHRIYIMWVICIAVYILS